jgi:hypothetical protein
MRYFSLAEAAAELGISYHALWYRVVTGKVAEPRFRAGKARRMFSEGELEDLRNYFSGIRMKAGARSASR